MCDKDRGIRGRQGSVMCSLPLIFFVLWFLVGCLCSWAARSTKLIPSSCITLRHLQVHTPLSHISFRVEEKPSLLMISSCFVSALTVCEFSSLLLIFKEKIFGLLTSNSSHFLVPSNIWLLKLKIMLWRLTSPYWDDLKNLYRNPKVDNLTLCTIPVLRPVIPKAIFAARSIWILGNAGIGLKTSSI